MSLINRTVTENGEVVWKGNQVLLLIEEATKEALLTLALEIEGQTKQNIVETDQVDTGFLLNTVYAIDKEGSGSAGSIMTSGRYTNRAGQSVERNAAPIITPPGDAMAAVVMGAEYAIFREGFQPVLYPAAVSVVANSGGKVAIQIKGKIGG